MRNTRFKSMTNGLSLGAIAGGPASSSETISTYNIIPCFSLTQPGRNSGISPGSNVAVWEGK